MAGGPSGPDRRQDPRQRDRGGAARRKKPVVLLIEMCLRHGWWLAWALYGLGAAWFLALPMVARGVFFDENALLPDSAASGFRHSPVLATAQGLRSRFLKETGGGASGQAWLASEMRALGLDTSVQVLDMVGPMVNASLQCSNVHGILRAPRGDGKEGMALVTPITLNSEHPGAQENHEAAALAVGIGYGLLAHFATVPWLAKDVVWVVTDGRCGSIHSMEEWLDAYQAKAASAIGSEFKRAGTLQQAVVVEVTQPTFDAVEIALEGYNGQLPKLDMYWLVKSLSSRVLGVPMLLSDRQADGRLVGMGRLFGSKGSRDHGYAGRLEAMLSFVGRLALGTPTGPHAAFKPWAVDAITMKPKLLGPGALGGPKSSRLGSKGRVVTDAGAAMVGLAETLELIFRSCNNLQEKLHHSYFMYLLVSTDRFLTIDLYMAPVALFVLAMFLRAGCLKAQAASGAQAPNWGSAFSLSSQVYCGSAALSLALACAATPPSLTLSSSIGRSLSSGAWGGGDRALAVLSAAVLIGVGCFETWLRVKSWRRPEVRPRAPPSAADVGGGEAATPPTHGAIIGAAAATQAVAICTAAAVSSAIVCVNWALAFVVLVALTPLTLIINPPTGRLQRAVNFMAILLLSPFAMFPLATALLTPGTAPSDAQGWAALAFSELPLATRMFWTCTYCPLWLLSILCGLRT
ncbi:unnamed protein product [Ostreobium quekettii]|uniref:Glycosylphosphatidylinositol anchor attachment 1 protein n=1 Tax=Ostreobium quekettii TaxID=121088 RepID=A0A8S1IT40_9CHLO|nr:unnamed protein product [Ostreobium quekettii]